MGSVSWGTESGLPVFVVDFSGVGSGAKGELYTVWPICGRVGASRSQQRIRRWLCQMGSCCCYGKVRATKIAVSDHKAISAH